MGDFLVRLQAHRRLFALGAVVLLPLSTAAATASAAGSAPQPLSPTLAVGATGGAVVAHGQAPQPVPALATPKTSPARWDQVGGHQVVVVPSVRQRVAQVSATTSYDVPLAALQAYRGAASALAASNPACHLSWSLLAGIGQVESDHGRYGGAVVLANGDTSPHILGPVLNGAGGVGAIRDTDGGRYDGDPVWDRAVGPMQFIPGTWAGYGADGNGDGVRDPNNIKDAALAAAGYLCAGGGDLRVQSDLRAAVMRYNHSASYVNLVLRLARAYARGDAIAVSNGGSSSTDPAQRPAGSPPPGGRDQHAPQVPGGSRPPGGGNGAGQGGNQGRQGGGQGGSGQGGSGGGHGGGGHGGPPPIKTHPIERPPTTSTPPSGHPTPTPTSPQQPTVPKPPQHQPPSHQPPSHQPPSHQPPTDHPTSPTPPPGRPGPGPGRHHHPTPPIATGVLTRTTTGWAVDTTTIDFGTADLGQRLADLDGDGRTLALIRELRSLERQAGTVTVLLDPAATAPSPSPVVPGGATTTPSTTVVTVATQPDDRHASSTSATGSRAAAPGTPLAAADPVVVTVDADGLVTRVAGVVIVRV